MHEELIIMNITNVPRWPVQVPGIINTLLVVPVLLMALPVTAAVIVDNGETLAIDGSTLSDDYDVRNGSTLNTNGASTGFVILRSGSHLNMVGGRVNGVGNDGVSVTNSTATISDASIQSDYVGLLLNRVVGTTTGSSAVVSNSIITGVDAGAQVTGLSTLVLNRSTVTGTGASGLGLNISGGDVQANANTIIKGQTNGVQLRNDPQNLGTPRLGLDGSSVEGVNGAAVSVIRGITTTIDVANGSSLIGGNGNLLEVKEASTANMNVLRSSLKGNVQATGNSTANLSFDQGEMTGDLVVESGSTGSLRLQNNSLFTGNLINVASVEINSQSNWMMAGTTASAR